MNVVILLRNSIRRGLCRVVLIPRKLHVVAVPRNPPFKTTLREDEDEELWRARETLDGKDQSTILHKVSAIRMFNEWRPGWGLWVTGMVKGCPGCNPCLFRVPFNHPVKSGESSEKQTTFYSSTIYRVFLFYWHNLFDGMGNKLILIVNVDKDSRALIRKALNFEWIPVDKCAL